VEDIVQKNNADELDEIDDRDKHLQNL